MRRLTRIIIGLVLLSLGCLETRAEQERPNIVLIFADDLGWGDVGFNGRSEWATPHLDSLAKQGTVFRRFYTAAVTCCPSRAASTGKSTIHCGVTRNDDDLPAGEVTLAEAMKARGYVTRSSASGITVSRSLRRRTILTPWIRASTSSSASRTRSTPGKNFPNNCGTAASSNRSRVRGRLIR